MEAGKMSREERRLKAYVERTIAKVGFRPAEGSEHRWQTDSEALEKAHTAAVASKGACCSCAGHEAGRQNECRHMRLIRLVVEGIIP